MKVVRIKEFGGPDQLVSDEVADLHAAAGEVVVKVQAAGVGLMDVFARMGHYPGMDQAGFVPGGEVCGEVVAVGHDVDDSWIGKRVFAVTRVGGYAEQAVVPASNLITVPDNLEPTAAVALGLNALVAHFSIRQIGLVTGEEVIVRGAGGGVGLACALFALEQGAKVTAVSSSPERLDRLRALGIENALDRKSDTIPTDSFDVVLDPSAGEEIGTFVSALRPNGRYLLNGVAAGFPPAEFGMSLMMNFQRSPIFAPFSLDSIAIAKVVEAGEEIFKRAAKGELTGVVDKVLPLDQASQAHEALQANQVFGKVVLQV